METTLTYFGKVTKEGRLELPRKRIAKEVQYFAGKDVEVIIRRKKRRRSNEQNGYYWAIMVPMIVDALIDLGHNDLQSGNKDSHEMIHEFLKGRFLNNGLEVSDIQGEVITLPPSTKRLSTVEFMDYKDNIQRWAAEFLGISIPDPNEQALLNLKY